MKDAEGKGATVLQIASTTPFTYPLSLPCSFLVFFFFPRFCSSFSVFHFRHRCPVLHWSSWLLTQLCHHSTNQFHEPSHAQRIWNSQSVHTNTDRMEYLSVGNRRRGVPQIWHRALRDSGEGEEERGSFPPSAVPSLSFCLHVSLLSVFLHLFVVLSFCLRAIRSLFLFVALFAQERSVRQSDCWSRPVHWWFLLIWLFPLFGWAETKGHCCFVDSLHPCHSYIIFIANIAFSSGWDGSWFLSSSSSSSSSASSTAQPDQQDPKEETVYCLEDDVEQAEEEPGEGADSEKCPLATLPPSSSSTSTSRTGTSPGAPIQQQTPRHASWHGHHHSLCIAAKGRTCRPPPIDPSFVNTLSIKMHTLDMTLHWHSVNWMSTLESYRETLSSSSSQLSSYLASLMSSDGINSNSPQTTSWTLPPEW